MGRRSAESPRPCPVRASVFSTVTFLHFNYCLHCMTVECNFHQQLAWCADPELTVIRNSRSASKPCPFQIRTCSRGRGCARILRLLKGVWVRTFSGKTALVPCHHPKAGVTWGNLVCQRDLLFLNTTPGSGPSVPEPRGFLWEPGHPDS